MGSNKCSCCCKVSTQKPNLIHKCNFLVITIEALVCKHKIYRIKLFFRSEGGFRRILHRQKTMTMKPPKNALFGREFCFGAQQYCKLKIFFCKFFLLILCGFQVYYTVPSFPLHMGGCSNNILDIHIIPKIHDILSK